MGGLTIKNSMRPKEKVRVLTADATLEENLKIINEFKHSRYPLMSQEATDPLGYVHVKDLFLATNGGTASSDLKTIVRPCIKAKAGATIEQVLSEMQRRGNHVALVYDDQNAWIGMATMEDLLEEVVGAIEEEFPLEVPVYLSDTLTPERVFLDVDGDSIISVADQILRRVNPAELPIPASTIMLSVIEREKLISSYVGDNIAIPHARLKILARPIVIVARLRNPIPAPIAGETINLIFLLLTPSETPRIHQVLLSNIARMHDSEFLSDRLMSANSAAEVYDVIKTAEQAALS
jgi:mannitol/fructose-specific phosphotransferase system IIA component (Ntr-type)